MVIVTLDIEASSLSNESYPIQIGYTTVTGNTFETKEFLIKPSCEWEDWDEEAESYIHNISRESLRDGLDIITACNLLNSELGKKLIIVDSKKYDEFWLDRLFDAANIQRDFEIVDVDTYLFNGFGIANGKFEDERENYTFEHQAGSDARMIMRILCDLVPQSPV